MIRDLPSGTRVRIIGPADATPHVGQTGTVVNDCICPPKRDCIHRRPNMVNIRYDELHAGKPWVAAYCTDEHVFTDDWDFQLLEVTIEEDPI